ncbi:hypothetical protein CKAN_02469100 [Cinnamomum micranthum f. kanehirae]|uniref:Uncharacterized protein n=1 Tax=Cinnamomum micranthum f. kanehirae TaxID=337451 RepID=A0A443PX89_9MAGN|nr:hypothetical protein CKAN_02469100 [Cinnamomum micranthum f. kanehirae]
MTTNTTPSLPPHLPKTSTEPSFFTSAFSSLFLLSRISSKVRFSDCSLVDHECCHQSQHDKTWAFTFLS